MIALTVRRHLWSLCALLLCSASTAFAASNAASDSIDARFKAVSLQDLNDAQQEQFQRIAEGELCPCKGSTESLARCLEAQDGTCKQAHTAARIAQRSITQGHSDAQTALAIQKGLKQAAKSHTFALEGVPYQGAKKPTVTMVVFADFECPYCQRMAKITERMLKAFPKDLRVYFMHFPLASHSNATDAAIAAYAAHKQGKFWPYHDKLFSEQRALQGAIDAEPLLRTWAEELGLDVEKFQEDIDNTESYATVRSQQESGRNAEVRGTPAIFLNGVAFSDIGSERALRAHIQSLIEEHTP